MEQYQRNIYFIIGGGGQIGYYLTKELLKDGYEVTLLEKDPRRKALLDPELGAASVLGDACEARTLERVGCQRATCVVAVTGDDEDNLVMCQLAKHHFAVPRTIARVNNVANIKLFDQLGIDVTISPTLNILGAIESELSLRRTISLLGLSRAGLDLVEVDVPADSPSQGQRLRDLNLPRSSNVVLIKRERQDVLPDADTVVLAGDKLYAVVSPDGQKALERQILGDVTSGAGS